MKEILLIVAVLQLLLVNGSIGKEISVPLTYAEKANSDSAVLSWSNVEKHSTCTVENA